MISKVTALLGAALLSTSMTCSSRTSEAGLSDWANSLPGIVDGVKIFSPVKDDDKMQISDIVEIKDFSQQKIFVNSLLDIQENIDGEDEEIENIDFENCRMRLNRSGRDDDKTTSYNYSVALQFGDGMLSFLIYDISVSFREKGIIPRTLNIEKLNLQQNKRHKELFEKCVINASRYIDRLVSAVRNSKAQDVAHWDELAAGKIVKGMNMTEVKLLKGMPNTERQSRSRTKWMYGNENVVVFTDGLVTTIL